MSDQRYRLIEKLEAGGMAEVFLGEATSVQGFKKRVAIKRVLPHLASHKNFIGMFLDEARLGARLSHANIVSVFDIGSSENSYFIVMEFIDGTNLKKIMETLRRHTTRSLQKHYQKPVRCLIEPSRPRVKILHPVPFPPNLSLLECRVAPVPLHKSGPVCLALYE